jgi:hypothetical protein
MCKNTLITVYGKIKITYIYIMSKSTCPCEQIYASATSQGSALVQTGDLVTANASATASSPVSYADALSIATKDAKQLANNYAQHDADVINQTLRIVNSHSLIPSTTGITIGNKTAPYSQIYTSNVVVLSNSFGNQVILTSLKNKLYANDAEVYTSANPQGSSGGGNTFYGENAGNSNGIKDGKKVDIPEIGFIAQDLKKVQVDTGRTIPNLVNPEKLEASYGALLPLLVKSIQELSQENKRTNAKIQELTLIIHEIKNNK